MGTRRIHLMRGLRRRRWGRLVAFTLLVLGLPSASLAQSVEEPTLRFFSCEELAFFGACPFPVTLAPSGPPPDGRSAPVTSAAPPFAAPAEGSIPFAPSGPPTAVDSLWTEPLGSDQAYLPPRVVREFLEDPTPERARAYLRWNERRLGAVRRALATLRVEAAEAELATSRPTPTGFRSPAALSTATATPSASCATSGVAPSDAVPDAAVLEPLLARTAAGAAGSGPARLAIVYVFATWCSYSARQTPILAAWVRERPDIAVVGVAMDSPPEAVSALPPLPFPVIRAGQSLKAALGIRAYPTVVILRAGQPVSATPGLISAAQLGALVDARIP
jgi:thiol-disulfide isomerase/thioredoxin